MIKGVDVSMLYELEELGARYFTKNGVEDDIFSIFAAHGINLVRLRLWNDPYSKEGAPYGGGTNDYHKTLSLARRAKKAGMEFVLNFHYSDFWTDPVKQVKPKAWQDFYGDRLGREVYHYTKTVLERLSEDGVCPDYVQVGNELTAGLLWQDGLLPNYEGMFDLLSNAVYAVRDFSKDIRVIIHLDNGGNNALYREWFGKAAEYGLDYDIIGLSYYPFWHGSLEDLSANMQDISKRHSKDLMVMETSYGYSTKKADDCEAVVFDGELAKKGGFEASPEGQAEFMRSLISCIAKTPNAKGFVYWCPEWILTKGSTWATLEGRGYIGDKSKGGNSWFNQAMFDVSGRALPILEMIRDC